MGHTSTSLFAGREWPFQIFRLLAGLTTRGRRVDERKPRVKRYFIYSHLQLENVLRKLPRRIHLRFAQSAGGVARVMDRLTLHGQLH
jgi:hypothetical protein